MEQKRPLRAREWLSWPMLAIEAPASEARRRRMLLVVTEEQPSQPPGCIGRERSTEPFKDPNRGRLQLIVGSSDERHGTPSVSSRKPSRIRQARRAALGSCTKPDAASVQCPASAKAAEAPPKRTTK